MNPLLPDEPGSKVNACVENILRIYKEGDAQKLTQLVFCDLSTPHGDGSFNVYDDIRDKLVASGIPKEEIQFIHDADTEIKKKDKDGNWVTSVRPTTPADQRMRNYVMASKKAR